MTRSSTLPAPAPPDYDAGMEARVAVLEQIAASTEKALTGLREDLREFRQEVRQDTTEFRHEVRQDSSGFRQEMREELGDVRQDIRWLLALGIAAVGVLLAVMAHGFRWF
jgi:hypothetical protein